MRSAGAIEEGFDEFRKTLGPGRYDESKDLAEFETIDCSFCTMAGQSHCCSPPISAKI